MRLTWRIFLPLLIFVVVIGICLLRVPTFVTQWQARHAVFTVQLNSKRPYHELEIPFRLVNGNIFIDAMISGKKVQCVLDTGTYRTELPPYLQAEGTETGETGVIYDVGGNIITHYAVLPTIRLGALLANNLPVQQLKGVYPNQLNLKNIKLSAELFERNVLTIDYQRKKLIVRDAQYFPSNSKKGTNYTICKMKSISKYNPIRSVDAEIKGHHLTVCLDTGFTGGLGVSTDFDKKFRRSTPSQDSCEIYSRTGKSSCYYSDYIMSISKIRFVGQAIVHANNDLDNIIGYQILRHFRVTFDYPRNRLILERYASDAPK